MSHLDSLSTKFNHFMDLFDKAAEYEIDWDAFDEREFEQKVKRASLYLRTAIHNAMLMVEADDYEMFDALDRLNDTVREGNYGGMASYALYSYGAIDHYDELLELSL